MYGDDVTKGLILAGSVVITTRQLIIMLTTPHSFDKKHNSLPTLCLVMLYMYV